MVYTHVPSSLLLFTIVAVDDFMLAAALFLLREALSQMDVPTRQSYVMAVVRPEERLAAIVLAAGLSRTARAPRNCTASTPITTPGPNRAPGVCLAGTGERLSRRYFPATRTRDG
jgi:hypothetical protein